MHTKVKIYLHLTVYAWLAIYKLVRDSSPRVKTYFLLRLAWLTSVTPSTNKVCNVFIFIFHCTFTYSQHRLYREQGATHGKTSHVAWLVYLCIKNSGALHIHTQISKYALRYNIYTYLYPYVCECKCSCKCARNREFKKTRVYTCTV